MDAKRLRRRSFPKVRGLRLGVFTTPIRSFWSEVSSRNRRRIFREKGSASFNASAVEVRSWCFVDEFECTSFPRVAVVEGTGVEHRAFGQRLDHRETRVEDRSLEHLIHVLHLRRVSAGDKSRTRSDELGHRIDRPIDGTSWIGLRFPDRLESSGKSDSWSGHRRNCP